MWQMQYGTQYMYMISNFSTLHEEYEDHGTQK